jgi:hypothetical protein
MSDDKREGPRLTFEASCFGCKYEVSEHYQVQSDSGCRVSCSHPQVTGTRRIGDTTWDTPKWCPLLPVATARFLEAERRTIEGAGR